MKCHTYTVCVEYVLEYVVLGICGLYMCGISYVLPIETQHIFHTYSEVSHIWMKESQEATHVNEGVSIGHTYETPHIPGVYMCCLLRLLHAYVLPLGTPGFICVAYWDSFTHMCCDMKCHATDEWQSLQRQHMCSLLGLLHSYVWPIETPSRICVATWSVTLRMNGRVSRGNICVASWDSFIHMCGLLRLLHAYVLRHEVSRYGWMTESPEATYDGRSPRRQHIWMKESQ